MQFAYDLLFTVGLMQVLVQYTIT